MTQAPQKIVDKFLATEPAEIVPATPATSTRTKLWHNVAVRLADEGVPVRAIVRALMLPYDEVREVLTAASERGMILSVPRDDWPPGVRRDERAPDTTPLEFEDEHMTMLTMRTFNITPTMAKIFVGLLRRPEMTKKAMHACSKRDGCVPNDKDDTDIKIVDVYVCKLRKFLPQTIPILTLWGKGYMIPPEGKVEALKLLGVQQSNFAIDIRKVAGLPPTA